MSGAIAENRYLVQLHQSSRIVSGIGLGCLVSYAVLGTIASVTGLVDFPYPFLVFAGDPVLNFLVSAVGFFITIAMGALMVHVAHVEYSLKRQLTVVISSAIAVGFGAATFYWSFHQLLQLL